MPPPQQAKLTYDQEAELQFQKKQEELAAKLTPAQKKVLQLFADFDDNRNERLEKMEFRKILVTCGMPSDKVTLLFNQADANNDGIINQRELLQWILGSSRQQAQAPSSIKKYMDRPTDPEEAKSLFVSFCRELCSDAKGGIVTEPPDFAGKVFFKESDVKQFENRRKVKLTTREVTSDDYLDALNSLFEAWDTNGNKYLSMGELVSGCQSYGFNCHRKVIELMFNILDNVEVKDKELLVGPTTRETTEADKDLIATGKIKYQTLTTKMKDGALDHVEFMAILGRELSAAEIDKLPDEVKVSVEQRKAALEQHVAS